MDSVEAAPGKRYIERLGKAIPLQDWAPKEAVLLRVRPARLLLFSFIANKKIIITSFL